MTPVYLYGPSSLNFLLSWLDFSEVPFWSFANSADVIKVTASDRLALPTSLSSFFISSLAIFICYNPSIFSVGVSGLDRIAASEGDFGLFKFYWLLILLSRSEIYFITIWSLGFNEGLESWFVIREILRLARLSTLTGFLSFVSSSSL